MFERSSCLAPNESNNIHELTAIIVKDLWEMRPSGRF